MQVDRAVGQVGEDRRRHRGVVPDQVALGHGLVRSLGRDQHLVEVGELQRVGADLPLPAACGELVERGQLVGVRRVPQRVARPGRRRRRLHLVVGPPGLDRPRMILGVPPFHGVLVALVEQHPLLAGARRRGARARSGRAASRRTGRSAGRRPRRLRSGRRRRSAATCPSPTRSRRRRRTRRRGSRPRSRSSRAGGPRRGPPSASPPGRASDPSAPPS